VRARAREEDCGASPDVRTTHGLERSDFVSVGQLDLLHVAERPVVPIAEDLAWIGVDELGYRLDDLEWMLSDLESRLADVESRLDDLCISLLDFDVLS
jgi:hypothetical protein